MIWKIPLWSKCWPVLLLSLASVMDKLLSALELPHETGIENSHFQLELLKIEFFIIILLNIAFWESSKSPTSSKISIRSTIMETKVHFYKL